MTTVDDVKTSDLVAQVTLDPAATARERLLVDRLSAAMEEIDDLVEALHRLHGEIVKRGWEDGDGNDR